jgi:hypothetical protein
MQSQKNKKELVSHRTATDRNGQTQCHRKNNEPLTAPKKNGGGSANTNSCATNKVWWV